VAGRLDGKLALVTAAAQGIGFATARAFAAEGARVFGVDVEAEGLTQTIASIRTAGRAAEGMTCDVTDAEAVRAAVARTVATFGGLDVLVNAAGVGRSARLEEIEEAEWQRVLAVNLTGPFNTTKAALPHLLAARGNIVNVASTAGMRGQAYSAHYAASKAGLVNFTRSVALELVSRGVRANCIAPAGIASPFVRNFQPRPDFEPSLVAYYSPPIPHRMSQPEDVAKTIAFLASDDVPMITGTVLVVDWGTLA
jgi:NAD(P)-dependent dehydrogenase (short-subunit alcohol dehydrogenase family)